MATGIVATAPRAQSGRAVGAVSVVAIALGAAIYVGAPVLDWLMVPLVALVGLIVQLGAVLWRRMGPPSLIVAIVIFDGGVSELVVSSPLYTNATFSQAALRLQAVLVAAALLCAVCFALSNRTHPLPALGRLEPFEIAIIALGALAVTGAAVGVTLGNDAVYLVGDSYRLALVPFAWLMVVWLVRDRQGVRSVLTAIVLVALLGMGFALERLISALAGGTTTYGIGIGSAPLLIIVGLLLLTFVRLSPGRTIAVTSVVVVGLALNVVSLSRNQMLGAVMAVGAFWILLGRRGSRALRSVATATVVGGLVVTLASPGVASEFDAIVQAAQRRVEAVMGDVGGTSKTENSLSERGTEASDSFADLQQVGPVALLIGRGTGAVFPTTLNPAGAQGVKPGFRHHIHITWASVLYRTGIVGLVLLVVLLVGAVLTAWRGARRARAPGDQVLWGTIAIWLVVTGVALNFAYGLIGELTWAIMLGLLTCLVRIDRRADSP